VVGEHIAGGPESLRSLAFMSGRDTRFDSLPVRITRCGYTGEDGFEVYAHTSHSLPGALGV
jgi:glycine cleavage system aminomethyltransferase T